MRICFTAFLIGLAMLLPFGIAESSILPSDINVADDKGGSMIVSCRGAHAEPGNWVEIQAGLAARDAYFFRPVGKDDMPGDEFYVACNDEYGQPGIVTTQVESMPPQFIVKKGDTVTAGDSSIVDVKMSDSNAFHFMMFFIKTYEGDSLTTTNGATVVINVNAGSAKVFRAPLVTTIEATHKGYGARRGASEVPATCTIAYYDAQLEPTLVALNLSCAALGKTIDWQSVIRGEIPAAYKQT
jgi:hypothetical protein